MQDEFDKRIIFVLPVCFLILFALIFLGMKGFDNRSTETAFETKSATQQEIYTTKYYPRVKTAASF